MPKQPNAEQPYGSLCIASKYRPKGRGIYPPRLNQVLTAFGVELGCSSACLSKVESGQITVRRKPCHPHLVSHGTHPPLRGLYLEQLVEHGLMVECLHWPGTGHAMKAQGLECRDDVVVLTRFHGHKRALGFRTVYSSVPDRLLPLKLTLTKYSPNFARITC